MEEETFICEFGGCRRAYSNIMSLNRHIDSCHIEENKLQCSYCHKILSSRQNLKEHVYMHTGERPYACKEPGCGLKFRQGSQLSAHKRIHSNMRRISGMYEIVPLNVILMQLAQLIEKQSLARFHEEEIFGDTIELPPITNSQEYTKIPLFS